MIKIISHEPVESARIQLQVGPARLGEKERFAQIECSCGTKGVIDINREVRWTCEKCGVALLLKHAGQCADCSHFDYAIPGGKEPYCMAGVRRRKVHPKASCYMFDARR
jgi:hypothetical protein